MRRNSIMQRIGRRALLGNVAAGVAAFGSLRQGRMYASATEKRGLSMFGPHWTVRPWNFIPGFALREHVNAWNLEATNLPGRRVNCGANVTWIEQEILDNSGLFRFFESAAKRFQLDSTPQMLCWISRYKSGEFINEHTDAAGDVQMILCLASVPPTHGGVLHLRYGSEHSSFAMEPGDALVFSARTVSHSTTPLRASAEIPYPERAVAVARFTWV